jgi:hypothetical protein
MKLRLYRRPHARFTLEGLRADRAATRQSGAFFWALSAGVYCIALFISLQLTLVTITMVPVTL